MRYHCDGFKNIALDIADYFADHGLDGWTPCTTWQVIEDFRMKMYKHTKDCEECKENNDTEEYCCEEHDED